MKRKRRKGEEDLPRFMKASEAALKLGYEPDDPGLAHRLAIECDLLPVANADDGEGFYLMDQVLAAKLLLAEERRQSQAGAPSGRRRGQGRRLTRGDIFALRNMCGVTIPEVNERLEQMNETLTGVVGLLEQMANNLTKTVKLLERLQPLYNANGGPSKRLPGLSRN